MIWPIDCLRRLFGGNQLSQYLHIVVRRCQQNKGRVLHHTREHKIYFITGGVPGGGGVDESVLPLGVVCVRIADGRTGGWSAFKDLIMR